MTNTNDVVIDLTSPLKLCNHNSLSGATIVIESDDSFDYSSEYRKRNKDLNTENKLLRELAIWMKTVSPTTKKLTDSKRKLDKFGCCAICWEEIGKNPLASTKCGHVFCDSCLKASLKVTMRCPTCRCLLKGKNAYHPLYLSKQ